MSFQDMKSKIRVLPSIAPVAVGTTGTGQTGLVVDTNGFDAVTLEFSYGAITATAAVFTATVLHGDVTGTLASVADADLIGTEADAGVAAAVRTDGTTEKIVRRIGYNGGKRYVRGDISSTTTAGTPVGCNVILGMPRVGPTVT